MASQSEWKNPSDIMKKHLIQRQSSFSLLKSKTVSKTGFSRRHSFTILSQTNDSSQNQHIQNSLYDTPVRSQDSRSQKRKNPFGCDNASGSCKRMSVLNQETAAENNRLVSPSQIVTSSCSSSTQQTNSDLGTDSPIETKQNRLLHALSLQEQKVDHLGVLTLLLDFTFDIESDHVC
jgi:hypothetical protein